MSPTIVSADCARLISQRRKGRGARLGGRDTGQSIRFFRRGNECPSHFPVHHSHASRPNFLHSAGDTECSAFLVRHRNSSAHAKGRGTRLAEDGNPWIAGTAVDEHRSWSAAGSRRADEFRRPCVLKDGALLSSRCTKRRSASPSARPVLLSPPMR